MSADPPGPASSDAGDPTSVAGSPAGPPPTSKVKAGRAAAGPKRTPRPGAPEGNGPRRPPARAAAPAASSPSSASSASSAPSVAAPVGAASGATIGAGSAATTVVDRPVPDVAPIPVPTPIDETGTVGEAARTSAPRPAPKRAAVRNRSGRRGRRVKRVVRRIDLWSVLKLSLVVYTCLYVAIMATLAVLWGVLHKSGTIEKVTSFLADVGLENFHFYGDQMFRAAAAIGAVGVMAGTVITVLATALVNVISEITGGIRLVVIEEDVQG